MWPRDAAELLRYTAQGGQDSASVLLGLLLALLGILRRRGATAAADRLHATAAYNSPMAAEINVLAKCAIRTCWVGLGTTLVDALPREPLSRTWWRRAPPWRGGSRRAGARGLPRQPGAGVVSPFALLALSLGVLVSGAASAGSPADRGHSIRIIRRRGPSGSRRRCYVRPRPMRREPRRFTSASRPIQRLSR